MTEQKEKITTDQLIQEGEERKAKYEADKAKWKAQELELKNIIGKKNDEILDLQHANESLTRDRDEWKVQAHAVRKTYQAEKKTKAEADFESEFLKLQQRKGINL